MEYRMAHEYDMTTTWPIDPEVDITATDGNEIAWFAKTFSTLNDQFGTGENQKTLEGAD